jgi:putative DNA primase/helicase
MNAETIAKALGGSKTGSNWMARCPVHHDRHPSLSIRDASGGMVLIHCHAGCDQARVISALRSRGLWDKGHRQGFMRPQTPSSANIQPDRLEDRRTADALRIWRSTTAGRGTPLETYLRLRGLTIPPPQNLRFHPGLKHPSGDTWPAMVALVTRGTDDTPLAIHRTFLTHEGTGKAPVEPQKMMLGPCRGGAVRLAAPSNVLMVGEGIETCLAGMQGARLPAWAALSTAGLRSLDLPNEVRDIIVLADGDNAGEAAARDCGLRWMGEGRRVRIARSPQGLDFNDLLLGRVGCIGGGAP